MSTNPTSGLTGNTHDSTLDSTHNNNTTNEKGGVIPTVLSYVGLGGNNSTSSNTASDATTEPAFGAAVGPGSNSSAGGLGSSSHTGTGSGGILGGSNTHDSHSGSTGGILGGSNAHNSSTGGILGGSNTHSGSTGGILGGNNTHNTHSSSGGLSGTDGYAPAPTLNPHDEERARVVAERAMGSTTTGAGAGGFESGVGHHSSSVGSTDGLTSGQHVPGAPGIGLGSGHESSHHGSGVGSGVGLTSGQHGSGLDSDRHGSGVGSGVGLTSGQHGSGLDSDRHGSGVGSGVGLGSGHDSARHGSGVGSGVGLDSSDSARHGSEHEHHGSTSGENAHKPPVAGNSKGNLENKSAIPTAGGVKLGEKHWGESDFVPEFPKVREEDKISSSSGQPDKSTRDNTSANTGSSTVPPSGHGEHGEQKEGLVDKVKDKLHMGGSK